MIVTKFRQKGRTVDMTDGEASSFIWGLMNSHGFSHNEDVPAYILAYCQEHGVALRHEDLPI